MKRLAFVLVFVLVSMTHHAADLPTGFTETLITDQLTQPTTMKFAPDGRLFVAEQGGSLRVIKDGMLLPTPFLTVSVDQTQERGLLGIAFDPDFTNNQYVYIYYTTSEAPIHNRVSRFIADGDVAVPNSETVVLDLPNLSSATNHNGGAIHFGPDGKLYIATGENADPPLAQSLESTLGKILRINSDGSIPSDNPFFAQTTGQNQAIWALGLRNPYNFAFEPGTGRMYINDVGQGSWEEINEGIAGANYGWPDTEGETTNPSYTSPLYAYPHGTACNAIVGAAFYNPTTVRFPADYVGDYFFADLCEGWIKRYDATEDMVYDVATNISSPVDVIVSDNGYLYYLTRGGRVYQVDYNTLSTITWVSPSGQTNVAHPFYEWSEIPGATAYEIYLAPTDDLINTLFYGEIASGLICLEGGCGTYLTSEAAWVVNGNSYTAYIRAKDGTTPLTEWVVNEFTVNTPPPAPPMLQAPTGTDTTQPTLQWTDDGRASFFQLYLAPKNDITNAVIPIPTWVSRADACGNWNSTTCAYTVPSSIPDDREYSLYMNSWGAGGFSTGGGIPGADGWATIDFNVGTVIGLTSDFSVSITDGIPLFGWEPVPGADGYQIFVALLDDSEAVQEIVHFNETPYTDIVCSIEFNCLWTLPTDGPIAEGTYLWAVRGFNGSMPSMAGDLDGWAVAPTFGYVGVIER